MAWAMHISRRGIELIKQFEGLRLTAYQCSAGRWTIGYGTTRDEHDSLIRPGATITEAEAEGLLRKDIDDVERNVNRLVTVEVNQNQFDALMSFAYNVGWPNFGSSTLLKLLNTRDFEGASKQFARWNKAGRRKSEGLVRRREIERRLFMGEVSS